MPRVLQRKWLLRLGLIGLALGVSLPPGYWFIVHQQDQDRLAGVVRKLDESDPDWTKDELCATRNARLPPDDRNSFRLIRGTRAAFPTGYTNAEPIPGWQKQPANTLPHPNEREALQKYLAAGEQALAIARRLVDYPDGGRPVVIAETPIDTDLTEVQDIRGVAWVLKLDALAAADGDRPVDAIRGVRALLNAERAVGDEPVAMSQMVREACAALACDTVGRVLGLGEPADGLADLQAELLREADFPRMIHSFRGERASLDQMFRLLQAGKVEGVEDEGLLGRLSPVPLSYRPEDHAFGLEVMTGFVEASRRPFDEQWAAFRAQPKLDDDDLHRDRRHLYALLFSTMVHKIAETGLRTRAGLLATAAGVACERHRQRFGRWPDSLDAIPKDILPAVPNDPFTGKPIVFRRLPDGIAVYSIGPDGQDDGGRFEEEASPDGRKTRDFGIRLWDPDKRRLPAPPKPEPPAENPPEPAP